MKELLALKPLILKGLCKFRPLTTLIFKSRKPFTYMYSSKFLLDA